MPFLILIINSYIWVLLLRIWMQWANCDYTNPSTQLIISLTKPLAPIRAIFPTIWRIDTSALFVALLLAVAALSLQPLIFPSLGMLVVCGVLYLCKIVGEMIFWMLLLRALASWVSQSGNLNDLLYQLTEPFLAPLRRILPPLGMFDLSPLAATFILFLLNKLAIYYFAPVWFYL